MNIYFASARYLLLIFCCFIADVACAAPPNLVVVFVDDLGWVDSSVQMMSSRPDSKSKIYRTPQLERFAKKGMIFSNAYAPSPVCSPSRDSILFGKTPTRLHHAILMGKANAKPDSLTTPKAIKQADPKYVTGHYGKWDCSWRLKVAGFDTGEEGSNGTGNHGGEDPKRIFSVTRAANSFMEEQVKAGKPFYLRLSHYAIHSKLSALPATLKRYKDAGHNDYLSLRAAVIEDLDTGFGMLLDKIDDLGIADNTIVIYTSDNGAQGANSRPLRAGKAWLWEGGIRVPMIARGPGVLPATYCDVPVSVWDMLPTLYELAGGKAALPEDLDGGSLVQLFQKGNKGSVTGREDELIFNYPWYIKVPMQAIRVGDFKLVRDMRSQQTRLFNVAVDIEENIDLTSKMPEKSAALAARMDAYFKDVGAETLAEVLDTMDSGHERKVKDREKGIASLKEKIARSNDDKEKAQLNSAIQRMTEQNKGGYVDLKCIRESTRTAW